MRLGSSVPPASSAKTKPWTSDANIFSSLIDTNASRNPPGSKRYVNSFPTTSSPPVDALQTPALQTPALQTPALQTSDQSPHPFSSKPFEGDSLSQYFSSSDPPQRSNYRSSLRRRSQDDPSPFTGSLSAEIPTPAPTQFAAPPSTQFATPAPMESTTTAESSAAPASQTPLYGQGGGYGSTLGMGGYGSGYGSYGGGYGGGYGGYGGGYGSGYGGGFRSGFGYGGGMMGEDGSFFSQSVDTLTRFSQLLDMNSWFFDQICDTFVGITTRMSSIRAGLEWLPHRIVGARQAISTQVFNGALHLDFLAPPYIANIDQIDVTDDEGEDESKREGMNGKLLGKERRSTDQAVVLYRKQTHRFWTNHFKDAVKRLRLSVTLCIGFLLFGLWRLYLFWRRSRRKTRSRTLLWDAFFGPSSHHISLPTRQRVDPNRLMCAL